MDAVEQQQPPKSGPFRPKLRYAHQGGTNPPLIDDSRQRAASLPDSYKRYLESTFRKAFKLTGNAAQGAVQAGS